VISEYGRILAAVAATLLVLGAVIWWTRSRRISQS